MKIKCKDDSLIIFGWLFILFRRAICVAAFAWWHIPQSITMMAILFGTVLLFVLNFFSRSHKNFRFGYLAILYMLLCYLISLICNYNVAALEFFMNFVMYCIPGALCATGIRKYKLAIKYYFVFSLIIFVTCAFLPLKNGLRLGYHSLPYFESGMLFGEFVCVPCFVGFYLYRKVYQKRVLILFEAVTLILTAVLANRGSLLTIILTVAIYHIWIERINVKTASFVVVITGMVLFFYQNILDGFIKASLSLKKMGVNSYGIEKYLDMLKNGDVDSSGRDNVFDIALELTRGHELFGIGIGTFSEKTRFPFVHNLFLDFYSTFGIIGGGCFFIIMVVSIIICFQRKDDIERVFILALMMQWMPRLLLSKTFVNDVPFWMFLSFVCSLPIYNKVFISQKYGLKNIFINNNLLNNIYSKVYKCIHNG